MIGRNPPLYAIGLVVMLIVLQQIFLPAVLFRAGPANPITPAPTVPPTLTGSTTATATSPTTVTQTPAMTVNAQNFSFAPQTVTINSGERVRWENQGGFHNIVADDSSFTNGAPSSAAWNFEHTFSTPGTFRYYCQVHGGLNGVGMSGTVIVQ